MKKNILFFLFLLISHFALAQNEKRSQEEDYLNCASEAAHTAKKQENITIFNDFVASRVAPTQSTKAWTYAKRANLLDRINNEKLKSKNIDNKLLVKEILTNFRSAIDSCSSCNASFRLWRYEFLQRYGLNPELMATDLAILKKMGYREDKKGIGLGLSILQGQDIWVGLNFSFLGNSSARYKIRELDPETHKKKVVINEALNYHLLFLPIALNYNTSKKTTEFAVSIIQINAPLMLDITKVGYRSGVKGEQGSGFYRPEIGLGIGSFSLSYGYNVWFNKTYRANEEKHLLQFRFTPILNSK